MSKPWTQQDRDIANTMRASGYGRHFIAERLGRSYKAVANFFDKTDVRAFHIAADAEPIGACPEWDRYKNNAITGSQRLASRIEALGLQP
jgi:hypothetical protein